MTKAQFKKMKKALEEAGWKSAKPYSFELHEAIKELDFFQEDYRSILHITKYILIDSKRPHNMFYIVLDNRFYGKAQWGFCFEGENCAVPFEYVFEQSSPDVQGQLIWHLDLFR